MSAHESADGNPDDRLLLWAGLLVLIAPVLTLASQRLAALALGMLVAGGLAGWAAWRRRRTRPGHGALLTSPWFVAALAVPGGLQLAVLLVPANSPARLLTTLACALGAGAAVHGGGVRSSRWLTTTRLFLLGQVAALAWAVRQAPHHIDVWVFLTDGARAILHGVDPYAITFPSIYAASRVPFLYGQGVVVDGHVTYGFPYPPVSVMWAVAGHLLGDVRIAGVIALGALAWLLSGPTADRRSRAVAVLLVVAPGAVVVFTGSWTEPSLLALLGLATWGMKTRRLVVAAAALGLFLVSKQYLFVVVPCLWLLRPLATRRLVAVVVGAGTAVTVPFVVAGPHAFWRSVVQWQLRQPFRPDSLSLLVAAVDRTGWPGPSVYNLLPVAAGLAVAVAFSLTAHPGPAAFATGAGLSLLTTVLLSKQAFINYYFLVGAAFLLAAWAARDAETPPQEHAPRVSARTPVPASPGPVAVAPTT